MKNLFKIFNKILVRFVAFSLAFFFGLNLVSIPVQTDISQKQESHLLNVEIYKSPTTGIIELRDPELLVIKLDERNRLTLNGEEFNFSDTTDLEVRLSEVFKNRKMTSVGEIEKSVYVRIDYSNKFGDLEIIVNALTKGGANPIYIDPFHEKCMISHGCGNRTNIKTSFDR